ncbi:PTS transporter subunit EIIC, partial [Bacillus sp. S1-R4H1-FB]|uniref:PTS transporter subunit EIIC n=1 Tax=Bacillus sp. S1-R4H1-FB TaxID=1973492 RepID=UPI0011233173
FLAVIRDFTTSYKLVKSYGVDDLLAGIMSFGALIILTATTPKEGGLNLAWTGAQGLFVAIIVALLVTEVFRFFVKRNITFKMPDGVPPAVLRSFATIGPAFGILTVVAGIQLAVKLAGTSVHEFIFNTIQSPLKCLAGTLPSEIVIV